MLLCTIEMSGSCVSRCSLILHLWTRAKCCGKQVSLLFFEIFGCGKKNKMFRGVEELGKEVSHVVRFNSSLCASITMHFCDYVIDLSFELESL